MDEKTLRMTTVPVHELINGLAIPTICSMLITSIYNMADTFFVAKIGTSATGAVGVVFSVMSIIQAIGFFCGHGSGNFMSRKLGSGERGEAVSMAVNGFVMSLFLGGVLCVVGLLNLRGLSVLLGSTETILPYTMDYLKYILIGAPFMCASLTMNNQLRFQGNAKFAMFGITTGGILNMFLDPLLIFGFNLGISGAAIATIFSQFISFVILLVGVYKSDSINYDIRQLRLNAYYVSWMGKGGLPSLTRQGITAVATTVLNTCAKPYGDVAIAGLSIVTKLTNFCFSVVVGFGQGFQPVCGFNYGARKFDRVREGFVYATKVGTVICLVMMALSFFFSNQIIGVFSNDETVKQVASMTLRLHAIAFPVIAYVTMANMMMQSSGKTTSATLLASARSGLFLIPSLLILPKLLGITGLELSQTAADFCSFVLSIPLTIKFLKEMNAEEEKSV